MECPIFHNCAWFCSRSALRRHSQQGSHGPQAPDTDFISFFRANLSVFQCLEPKTLPLSSLTYTKYSLCLPTKMSVHCCKHLCVTPHPHSLISVVFLGLCAHAISSGGLPDLTSKVPSYILTKCPLSENSHLSNLIPKAGSTVARGTALFQSPSHRCASTCYRSAWLSHRHVNKCHPATQNLTEDLQSNSTTLLQKCFFTGDFAYHPVTPYHAHY